MVIPIDPPYVHTERKGYAHDKCDKRIAELEAEVERLTGAMTWAEAKAEDEAAKWLVQAEKYADALREIAEHPHVKDGCSNRIDETAYNLGLANGHRCAAKIAKRALGDRPKEE